MIDKNLNEKFKALANRKKIKKNELLISAMKFLIDQDVKDNLKIVDGEIILKNLINEI